MDLKKHVEELKKKGTEILPHSDILNKLKSELSPIDFEKIANEKKIDNFKVGNKEYLVISIEEILKVAKNNRWGLCKNQAFIYLYNGAFWENLDKNILQKFLGECSEKMGISKFNARYHIFRDNLFKQFLATAYLPSPLSNKDQVLVNLQNGTFEITQEGRKLRPFDQSDFLTYQLPFKYDPDADCPLYDKYLNRVLPDIESRNVLAEYLGYVFIKHGSSLKLEKALILYGSGANGKSVFYEIVTALLGRENTSSYSLQELTDQSGYYRAKIADKLVNYSSEINGKLETESFKKMVSGESIGARLPYGEPMELNQYAKFIFNSNELPKEVEHTNAYYRRFLIIPFDVTIPDDEQDATLHSKIISTELSGIFNWVLKGLDRLLKNKGFSHCKASDNALEQYKNENNNVKSFLDEEGYQADIDLYTEIKDLYAAYKSYCIEVGNRPFSKKNFAKQLRQLEIVVENGPGNKVIAFLKK